MKKRFTLEEWLTHPSTSAKLIVDNSPPESSEDAGLRRFKEKSIFIVALVLICTFFLICVYFLFQDPHNTLAGNFAFGIVTGLTGYVLRGK